MPQLALPFAAVGLCAGWLSAGLLANPILDAALGRHQPVAALVSAAVGALVGAYLSRACAPHVDGAVPPYPPRLVPALLLGGAVAGASVGMIAVRAPVPLGSAVAGMLCALAALPICATVVHSAQRSARGRMGSLVARSDARAVWSILAVGIGTAAAVALLDWPGAHTGALPAPMVAVGIAALATAAVAVLLHLDLRAARAIERAASAAETMEPRSNEHEIEAGEVPRVDLGLGDEVLAQVTRRDGAYRSRERSTALLLGSSDEARDALRAARRRAIAGLVALGTVLALHGLASQSNSGVAYHLFRCDRGVGGSCRAAAEVMESNGRPGRATALHRRACALRDRASCQVLLARGPIPAYERACNDGDHESCRALASLLLRGMEHPAQRPDPAAAARVLRGACGRGDLASCRRAVEVESAAVSEKCLSGSSHDCELLARTR
jgi:hypothetical protein